jgi:hypothetical protein
MVARVIGGRGETALAMMRHDPVDRGLARSLFAVAQDLTKERPERDGSFIDVHDREQISMSGEDPRDPLGGQHVGKRQAGLGQDVGRDPLKNGRDHAVRIALWCIVHANTLPGVVGQTHREGRARLSREGSLMSIGDRTGRLEISARPRPCARRPARHA